ncbi:MAG: DUF1566 domain-containing protein, partial [Heliobacteriaceae bacterium]|nr:DUF1566 domain-containing protein [Heliobacteriaceae bacterium]
DVYTLNANIFNTCSGIKIGNLCVSSSNESYSSINTCDGSSDLSYDTTGSNNAYCANNYWAGAKKHCADLGMSLPTRDQLLSLKGEPATSAGISGWYWSSEPYGSDANLAWGVGLPDGVQSGDSKLNGNDVRCVR